MKTEIIEQVIIKNYQSHVDTTIDLHPGVNVFFGSTGNGKSSIIRVCRWVVENRPIGSKHRTRQSTETFGTLQFSNNETITRLQTDTKNQYILSGVKKPLKTVRTDVPEAVSARHNIGPDNFQIQKDSYFLLDLSPGQVAKKLNKLAGLSQIDDAIKEINTRIRIKTQTRKDISTKIKDKKKQIKNLDWLDAAQRQLNQISIAQKKNNVRAQHITTVSSNITLLKQLQSTKDGFIPDDMTSAADDILTYTKQHYIITTTLLNIKSIIKTIQSLHQQRKEIVDIDLTDTTTLIREYQKLGSEITNQDILIAQIESLKNKSNKKTKKIEQLHNEYQELLTSTGRCPLCHGEL